MDRNTIVGLLLIFGIVLGVSFYNSSQQRKFQQEKAERETAVLDSLMASGERNAVSDSTANFEPQTTNHILHTADRTPPTAHRSPFFTPDTLTSTEYVVETDKAVYRFSKMGGYLNFAHLKDIYAFAPRGEEKPPLILFDGRNTAMNIDLMLQNQMIVKTQLCYFASEYPDTLVVTENNNTLSLRLYPIRDGEIDNASYIEYLYTFSNDAYSFGFHINYVNMQHYLYPNTNVFTLQWDASLLNVERSWEVERNTTTIFYMDNLNKVGELNATKSEKKDFSSQLKWVSFKQQFFTTVLIADSGYFSSGQLATDVRSAPPILKHLSASLEFDVRNLYNGSFDMTMYIGPNQFSLLRTYGLNLERQVPIGWGFFLLHWINRGVVIPVFNWLSGYNISYGIIILILTILLKLVLMPVAYKTYLSSARMRVLKPEVEEINAKFPKPEDAMKKQQATMALYRSAGVNPMSGCLPVLLQMPILIAMFRFFPSAYELRQQSFLWADDLSTYDSVLELGFNIPFYGDHVSLFCLLMTAATLVYTWMNNKMMTMGNAEQMKMMRIFMYFMPVMFLGIFNNFAAGLTYYYLLVNLITFLQMWIFRISVDEGKIRARLQANMAKPKKKSKWQARMEEMVKQQQMQQKGRK
ncbi:MAG: membrane protein insertase YidC [Bacteroidetes bacterium]|nr:membrane protein insertase YidC [Bacteroidota bacterium]MCL2303643.1 membrane protein insertase YidC [Lentimicrobiaceae bacterium]